MNKFDDFYMDVAYGAAKLSRAIRLKVGSVAVKGNNILAYGYNGTLPGQDNACEHYVDDMLVTKDDVVHAEENAIIKIAQSTQSCLGATLYTTISPCEPCARKIAACGFVRLVYGEMYRNDAGMKLLEKYGVIVEKHQ